MEWGEVRGGGVRGGVEWGEGRGSGVRGGVECGEERGGVRGVDGVG